MKLKIPINICVSYRQAVDFLSNEGHIFSTIDEDHYRSTDNDV